MVMITRRGVGTARRRSPGGVNRAADLQQPRPLVVLPGSKTLPLELFAPSPGSLQRCSVVGRVEPFRAGGGGRARGMRWNVGAAGSLLETAIR